MTSRDGNAEARIQRAVLEYLHLVAPDVKVFHIPNGAHLAGTKEQRDRSAARLKWQGMTPGVPDLIGLIPGGRAFLIEVKADGGRLSIPQAEFRDWCLDNNYPWMTARCVEDVRAALARWRVPNREVL